MAIKVGINGFGRIGRNILRASLGSNDIDIVAVNDITDTRTLAHLLKYDSILGNLHATIESTSDSISVNGDAFKVLSSRDPGALPWKDLGVEIVFESTGLFTDRDDAAKHLAAGAKKVIISAPAKKPDVTFVHGRQRRQVRPGEAPHHLERVVHDELPGAGGEGAARDASASSEGWMTTIHSYTNDQKLLDLPHKDLRRARAAALSMIPTTTGAAKAVGECCPS